VLIDIWEPGVQSRSSNKVVLTIIDGFSRWAHAEALPDHTAETVAKALYKLFNIVGWPRRLHSDNGPEFVGEVIREWCKLFGVEKTFTTSYHPQGNAQAERLHKYFRQAIASYCTDDHRIWDELLGALMNCYNESYHSALGVFPNQVYFGHSAGQPPNFNLEKPESDYTLLGYVQKQEYIMAKTHEPMFDKIMVNSMQSSLIHQNLHQSTSKKMIWS